MSANRDLPGTYPVGSPSGSVQPTDPVVSPRVSRSRRCFSHIAASLDYQADAREGAMGCRSDDVVGADEVVREVNLDAGVGGDVCGHPPLPVLLDGPLDAALEVVGVVARFELLDERRLVP